MAFDPVPDDEREFLATLSPDERLAYLRSRQKVRADSPRAFAPPDAPQAPKQAPGAPQAPQGHGQAIAVPFATGGHRLNMAMYTHPVAQSQAQHLQGMINATTSAWQDENDSRVAQVREQSRMDHETQLEAMRNEAMLQRLQKELEDRERERRARNGGLLRRINGGDWEVV